MINSSKERVSPAGRQGVEVPVRSHRIKKKQTMVPAKVLARPIGRMSAAILAVFPAPPLHYRSLQALQHRVLAVSPEAREDLQQPEPLQWSDSSYGQPTSGNRDRCLHNRVGRLQSGRGNGGEGWGLLELGGEPPAHTVKQEIHATLNSCHLKKNFFY